MEEFHQHAKKYSEFLSKKRIIDTQYSIPIFSGLIVLASARLFTKFTNQSSFKLFKNAINQAQSIKLASERNLQNKLVYAQGNIIKSNEVLAKDKLLNMTSSSVDNLGIYRKVEVLQKKMFKQENESWFNINMLADTQRLNFDISLRSQVATNGTLTVENHELTNPLLLQLANLSSNKKALDTQRMQNFLIDLEMNSQNTSTQCNNSVFGDLSSNLLVKLKKEGKYLSLKDDYIHIQTSPDRSSNGDIRISFHDVNKIAEVTLLAAKNGNLYQQFEQDKYINKNLEIQYNKNGKTVTSNISLFSFITSGQLEKEELIKNLMAASKQNVNRDILIYSLIIFSLYLFIHNNLLLPFDTSQESYNEIRRKEIAKIIVEGTDLTNVTSNENKDYQSILQQSLLYSCLNIGLLKAVTMGFLFSSIWVGFCATIVFSDNLSRSINLEKQMKENIEQLKNEKTHEGLKQQVSSSLNIMKMLNN